MATPASPFFPAGHALTADEFQYAVGYRVVSTGDAPFTANAFSDVVGLSIPNVPLGYYAGRLICFYDGATAGDLQLGIAGAGTAGAACRGAGPHIDSGQTTLNGSPYWGHEDYLTTGLDILGAVGVGSGVGTTINFTLQTVVAGEVKIQAKNPGASSTTTVRLFTVFELMPIR